MSYGWLTVDGVQVPIVRIELAESLITITAQMAGPLAAHAGWATVFGRDGYGILQSSNPIEWPTIPPGGLLTIKLPMRVLEVTPDVRREVVR